MKTEAQGRSARKGGMHRYLLEVCEAYVVRLRGAAARLRRWDHLRGACQLAPPAHGRHAQARGGAVLVLRDG